MLPGRCQLNPGKMQTVQSSTIPKPIRSPSTRSWSSDQNLSPTVQSWWDCWCPRKSTFAGDKKKKKEEKKKKKKTRKKQRVREQEKRSRTRTGREGEDPENTKRARDKRKTRQDIVRPDRHHRLRLQPSAPNKSLLFFPALPF